MGKWEISRLVFAFTVQKTLISLIFKVHVDILIFYFSFLHSRKPYNCAKYKSSRVQICNCGTKSTPQKLQFYFLLTAPSHRTFAQEITILAPSIQLHCHNHRTLEARQTSFFKNSRFKRRSHAHFADQI